MSSSHNPGGGSRDDYTFKIMMIGDSGVGKTGIMERFADDSFNEGHAPTIGVDFKVRTITFDDKPVKLQIWDASGQDKYKEAVSSYYKEADGVIIVYDVTNRESFANIKDWLDEVKKGCNNKVTILLVGNKTDAERRRIDHDYAEMFSFQYRIPLMETSAKDGSCVREVFDTMVKELTGQAELHAKDREEVYDDDLGENTTPVRMPIRAVEQCKIAADAGGQGRNGKNSGRPQVREGFSPNSTSGSLDLPRLDSAGSAKAKRSCSIL